MFESKQIALQRMLMGGEDDASSGQVAAETASKPAMSVAMDTDYEKAQQTKNQKNLWEDFLEMRIQLQRLLTLANKLPQTKHHNALCRVDERVDSEFKGASTEISTLSTAFLDIRDTLFLQTPALAELHSSRGLGSLSGDTSSSGDGSSSRSHKHKRKHAEISTDELWEELDGGYKALGKYRDEVLEHWHRRAQVSRSYHVISCHIMSCHVMPCHIIELRIILRASGPYRPLLA